MVIYIDRADGAHTTSLSLILNKNVCGIIKMYLTGVQVDMDIYLQFKTAGSEGTMQTTAGTVEACRDETKVISLGYGF